MFTPSHRFDPPANLRAFLFLFLLVLFALPGGLNVAEGLDEAQHIPILQFRSYDSGWLRYYNQGEDDEIKLAPGANGIYLFRRVVSAIPLGLTELENADAIARLTRIYRLSFAKRRIDGQCDTEKLRAKSSDVFCVPGSSALPIGYIFLALYHPRTKELAALTTTIDNSTGRANPAETAADSCGPYVPGQWIKAAEYAASGLSLLVVEERPGSPITDYTCIVPEDGAPPYLLAYSLASGGKQRGDKSTRRDRDKSQRVEASSQACVGSCSGDNYRKTTDSTGDYSFQPPWYCLFLKGPFYLDCVLFGFYW